MPLIAGQKILTVKNDFEGFSGGIVRDTGGILTAC